MEEIGKIIKDFNIQASKANSERAFVIQEFVEEINKEREGTEYKPVVPAQIAVKLSHLKKPDLYWFLSQCRDYRTRNGSFSKYFWGCLKNK